jgi:ankyrin repeat protein
MFTTFGPGRPPLIAAVGFGDLAGIDHLLASGRIDKKSINDALWYSCGDQDPQILLRIIQAGADVNQIDLRQEFGSCLMIAVGRNAPEIVHALIESGAKVNGPQGKSGETPLALATSLGSRGTAVAKMLRDAGAN